MDQTPACSLVRSGRWPRSLYQVLIWLRMESENTQLEQHQKSSCVLCLGCVCVLQELADRRGCHSGESLIARESILTSRRRTAELPEAADGIEPLDDEQAVSMVPDGQHPALAGAGRGGELRATRAQRTHRRYPTGRPQRARPCRKGQRWRPRWSRSPGRARQEFAAKGDLSVQFPPT
jgi:hypothetical protein